VIELYDNLDGTRTQQDAASPADSGAAISSRTCCNPVDDWVQALSSNV
jgi:hypothetical protein